MTSITHSRPPVPEWLNLDAYATADDLARIDQLDADLRDLLDRIVEVVPTLEWARSLADRFEGPAGLSDFHEQVEKVLGTRVVDELADLAAYLLAPTGNIAGAGAVEIASRLAPEAVAVIREGKATDE